MNRCLLVLVWVIVCRVSAAGESLEVDVVPQEFRDYPVVEYATVRVAPDQYKYKKVAYEGSFNGYLTEFPDYVEESGFSSRRYIVLKINDVWSVPVIARKTDDLIEQVAALKPGAKVKVYGKIRGFRRDPKWKTAPHYYLDLGHLQILDNRSRNEIQADRRAERKEHQQQRQAEKNREF